MKQHQPFRFLYKLLEMLAHDILPFDCVNDLRKHLTDLSCQKMHINEIAHSVRNLNVDQKDTVFDKIERIEQVSSAFIGDLCEIVKIIDYARKNIVMHREYQETDELIVSLRTFCALMQAAMLDENKRDELYLEIFGLVRSKNDVKKIFDDVNAEEFEKKQLVERMIAFLNIYILNITSTLDNIKEFFDDAARNIKDKK